MHDAVLQMRPSAAAAHRVRGTSMPQGVFHATCEFGAFGPQVHPCCSPVAIHEPISRRQHLQHKARAALPQLATAQQHSHSISTQLLAAGPAHYWPQAAEVQEHKYRWVSRTRPSRYAFVLHIPTTALPNWAGEQRRYHSSGYSSPEAAARAADVHMLALRGPSMKPFLNFPDADYSADDIAAAGATLAGKYPGLKLGDCPVGLRRAVSSPQRQQAHAAAMEAVQRVQKQRLDVGRSDLTGFSTRYGADRSVVGFSCVLQAATHAYRIECGTELEAACSYDLARRALYGPQSTINFPPSVYTDDDTEAFRQHIQVKAPGMLEAAAANSRAVPDYQHVEAGRAADAAVAAAAAAAVGAEAGYGSNRGYGMKRTCVSTKHAIAAWASYGQFRWRRYYRSQLEASCAADLMSLTHGRCTNLNLPLQTYTSDMVAAMRGWMQLHQARHSATFSEDIVEATASQQPTAVTAPAAEVELIGSSVQDPFAAALAAQAAATAAKRVAAAGLYADGDSSSIAGVAHRPAAGQYVATIQLRGSGSYSITVGSCLQAACAYDLARRALWGPNFTLNFPPELYTAAEDAAFIKDIEQVAPQLLKAAAATAQTKPRLILDYHQLVIHRAADAAVEAAAAEAAGLGYVADPANRHAWRQRGNVQEAFITVVIRGRKHMVTRRYDTPLKAACAADLLRLVLGGRRLNLPREYISRPDWIAAMEVLVQLEVQLRSTSSGGMTAAVTELGKHQQQQQRQQHQEQQHQGQQEQP